MPSFRMITPMLIPLHRRDGTVRAFVTIDVGDAWITQWRWSLSRGGYAMRTTRRGGGRRGPSTTILLHRLLLALERGDRRQVDHVNGDRLDCRRANLRVVPGHAANRQNVVLTGGSSAYRGVSWDKRTRSWRAGLKVNGRSVWIGRFDDEVEAAKAAAEARRAMLPYSVDGR